MAKYYPLAEEEKMRHWFKYHIAHPLKIMGIRTGEFRQPLKNEYYVSGAIPEVYQSPNDFTTKFHIVKLCIVEEVKVYNFKYYLD